MIRNDSLSSDLDFRIEKGNLRTFDQLTGFQMELEKRFLKETDVLTTQMLSESLLPSIQPEEVLIYACD